MHDKQMTQRLIVYISGHNAKCNVLVNNDLLPATQDHEHRDEIGYVYQNQLKTNSAVLWIDCNNSLNLHICTHVFSSYIFLVLNDWKLPYYKEKENVNVCW